MILQFKLCLKQYNRRLGSESKVSISEDGMYVAFSDIENNLLLFNRNRNTVDLLGKKAKPIRAVLVCDAYVVAAEEGSSELFVYSIKNSKLKKSLSFSTSKITCLGYSKDRKLLFVQSKNNCIICRLSTLTKQKVLSCSTSNFVSSSFTQDGKYLVNFFDDSSVIFWNLDTYTNQQTSNPHIQHITAGTVGLGKYIVLACNSSIYIANYVKDRTRFQKVIEVKGSVESLRFVRNYLVIQSTYGLYIGSVHEEHSISGVAELMAVGVKLFEANGEYLASTNLANDIVVTKAGDMAQMSQSKSLFVKQVQNNLLDNVGFYCAGGFDNREGCGCTQQSIVKHQAPTRTHYLEKIYKSVLISNKDLSQFSRQKLTIFLLKRNRFVDKHRAITYQYLLQLPLRINNYKDLVRKGLTPQIKHLRLRYPIKDQSLFSTFELVLSLLSHYCPDFANIEHVPALVFPLVLAFGEDQLFCFELSLYFLTYWMNPLFQTYPQPNVDFIYSVEQIIKYEKPLLLSDLREKNLPLSHIIWSIYSTFFTESLSRNNYMSMLDTLVCFNDTPSLVIFEVAGYIIHNAKLLSSIKTEKQLFAFISRESNEDCDKLMRLIHNLSGKYKNSIQFKFSNPCLGSEGYRKYNASNSQAVLYERDRRRAEERSYIDMERENQFYEEGLQIQQQEKVQSDQRQNKQAIKREIQRYRDLEYERRRFDEMSPAGKLELIENKGLEIPRTTYSHVPLSLSDASHNINRGCCTKQRFFQRTRAEY